MTSAAHDPAVLELAEIIFEAKKEDAWGNQQSEYRGKWPATRKLLRQCIIEERDSAVLCAVAQAQAVLAAGYRKQ